MPGIIKSNELPPERQSQSGAVFNFDDMSERAEAYLGQVKAQAAALLEQARSEAEACKVRAIEEGRQEALRQARQEALGELDQRMKTALPALESAADQLLRQRSDWEARWEKNAVQLAVRMAEKIIGRALADDPQIPLQWIRESLGLIARQEQVTIELSPSDVGALEEQIEVLLQSLGRLAATQVQANPQLNPGDCRLLTVHGEIDHRVQTQLQRLESELA